MGMILAGGCMLTANAQKVDVSPVPQSVNWGQKAFNKPSGLSLKGEKTAGAEAVASLRSAFPGTKGVNVIIGERGDKAVAKYVSKIPEQPEGYYLSIKPGQVVIAGNDEAGTFYGVQSFLQIASQPEVMSVEIADWPMTKVRGVIEGFYGNPWSFDDRVSQFDFYGRNKMNIYIYGPKDDPYHHSRWYEPYPAEEAAKMADLVKHATQNKVKFVWAMHPSNSIQSAEDKQKALDKFNQMYDLGIRAFAIFFDDISAKSVDAQVDYLNFLTDEFVRKHDDVEPLIVCPTQYNKLWAGGDYLPKMGKGLYPEIRIMWTGNSVIDMIDLKDCEWFKGQTGRDPFIWLNYPVNDYGLHHLLMGPAKGNGSDIYNHVSAFCSNPMQYAEASKVALYGLADFAWNPESYDADAAWERSMTELMPDHAKAFASFCIDNVDIGPSGHMLRLEGESPAFKAINDKYNNSITPESEKEYRAYFNNMTASANELLSTVTTSPMINEIKEFVEYYGLQGRRGELALAINKDMAAVDTAAMLDHYREYVNLTAKADKLMSRDFEGSIQSVAPRTATMYVEPFITTTVAQAVSDYKDGGYSYPADLFPAQVVENGTYYIKVNGRILGNPAVDGVAATAPVLQDDIDGVNPGRQLWVVKLDPKTGRYQIVNEWDKRYINELGRFTVNPTTNPFESDWHTYTIVEKDGKFAIANGGIAGRGYWTVDADGHITIDKKSRELNDSNYVFEFVPAND